MGTLPALPSQSEQPPEPSPYLTVGIDGRGSCCWMIVANDMRLPCTDGVRAVELLRAVCKSKGFRPPV